MVGAMPWIPQCVLALVSDRARPPPGESHDIPNPDVSVPESTSRIYLNVPFPAKERAKGLGARWDPLARKWYVSDKVQLGPFEEWLPVGTLRDPVPYGELEAAGSSQAASGVALSAYLAQVAEAIAVRVPRSQWVRAEISQLRPVNGGHLAIELVEHDSDGRLIARVPGFVWSARVPSLCDAFSRSTGAELAVGLKVLLQLSAELSSAYGLRTIVEDIDPTYTLGDIEAKVKAIRETLERERIAGLNRDLPPPSEFCRVAVISPQDAAGLGDFRRDADRLHGAGVCRFDYYTAKFQGQTAATSLLEAIELVGADYEHGARFDALCIIRGGGSVTDLYWLNELDLARAVCRFPVPVFTGIGHERDRTVLDEVAHRACDTPSKVIGWIATVIHANANAAVENMLGILRTASSVIGVHERTIELLRAEVEAAGRQLPAKAEFEVQRCVEQIRHRASSCLQAAEHALSLDAEAIRQSTQRQIAEADQGLVALLTTIGHFSRQRLGEAEFAVESLAREVLGLGPKATLRRGFALVRNAGGAPISSAAEAAEAGKLDIEFRDGRVYARVESTNLGSDPDE